MLFLGSLMKCRSYLRYANLTGSCFSNLLRSQLVQFLLKQAGVDKRTGDLYGNRDLMNIALNMARGLKVCDIC